MELCKQKKREVNNMKIQIGEFKGHPFMTLVEGEGRSECKLNFGVKKAKMILAAIDHIKEFVVKNDNPALQQPVLKTIAEVDVKLE